MSDNPVVNVGTVGHVDHGRDRLAVVVVGCGHSMRGHGKSLLGMLAILEAKGYHVEQVDADGPAELLAAMGEAVGRGPIFIDEFAHISQEILLAEPRQFLVESVGRHGGGKGRRAHKKNAAKFGHGWQ